MAKKEETPAKASKQGAAVVITDKRNGKQHRRLDYIRDRYYKNGVKRGDIVRELKEHFDHEIVYQVVFAATREKEDPRTNKTPEGSPASATKSAAA